MQQLLNVTGNNLLDQMYQATPLDASTATLDVRQPCLITHVLPHACLLQLHPGMHVVEEVGCAGGSVSGADAC